MKNYTYCETLNIFLPNEQYETIKNSMDLIFTTATLVDYVIKFYKNGYTLGHKEDRFVVADIIDEKNNKCITLHFNYNLINGNFILNSMDLYYRPSRGYRYVKQISGTNYKEIFNEVSKLLI